LIAATLVKRGAFCEKKSVNHVYRDVCTKVTSFGKTVCQGLGKAQHVHGENPVRVAVEGDVDLRRPGGRGGDATQREVPEQTVVFGHRALALR
jgi:hypothetical protein